MAYLWDYDEKELRKTQKGKIFILERMINYGPGKKKISLALVKKYWTHLHLTPLAHRLFELLLWGKYLSSPKNRRIYWKP